MYNTLDNLLILTKGTWILYVKKIYIYLTNNLYKLRLLLRILFFHHKLTLYEIIYIIIIII